MKIEVYISNISEDVWSFIQTMHVKERAYEIEENAYLADRDIISQPEKVQNIVILPVPLDQSFLDYYHTLFPNIKLQVWTPSKHTGETCLDILHDESLMKKLIDLGKTNALNLKSYSASAQFYSLVTKLRESGANITADQSPNIESSWLVNFYGSKSGIRQSADQLGSVSSPWISKGYICHNIVEAAALAANTYNRDKAVVIKTNKAHAGAGVKIFKEGDLPLDYEQCYQELENFLKSENYWKQFPIIVENYMDADMAVGGGNPNCEFIILPNGKLEALLYCGMRVTSKGVFKGIEVHKSILPNDVKRKLTIYGKSIGNIYKKNGYKGYFDIDCVYTKDKKLLITESNVRRTGGTHIYHAAKKLFGKRFSERVYTLSSNVHHLKISQKIDFNRLHNTLLPILFSKDKKEGLIISSVLGLEYNFFGYIIFGKDKKRAYEIETKMEKLLAKLP